MDLFVQTAKGDLDKEWLLLVQTARTMGISIEEIRCFLNKNKTKEIIRQEQSFNTLEEAFVNNT